ncbi:MAG TPA: Flp family type IVb pilin [Nocardioides sp.]
MIEFYCKFMAFMTAERDEEGATAVEYGLLVALIAAVIIGVIGFLGQDVLGAFNDIEDVLNGDQG